ncbi:MAG TPA: signal peptidase II [Elusimicrobiales bacterium]|nr:signal peptidase II [Elusimicrobiales bacterium]
MLLRGFLSPAIVLSVILLDRLTKWLVLENLRCAGRELLPFLSLTYVENTGVSFGMFRGNNGFFIVFSAVLVCALMFFRRRLAAHGAAAGAGAALVLGGAVGNLYDRIVYGHVVDFVDLSFFPAVFNVADASITAGAVLLAFGMRDEGPASGPGREQEERKKCA